MLRSVAFGIPSICGGDDTYRWREQILESAKQAFEAAGEHYPTEGPVTVDALVVLTGPNDMRFRDVDNLLKDILDGLRRALADTPEARRVGVIRNDHQVWKATVEKKRATDCADAQGTLTIRAFRPE
jgi:Holliday junction resolvase RusA-like endonuclease